MGKKIGVMGGTFDPIHIGHLILAEDAYVELGLTEVLFMPAGHPPHKVLGPGRATSEERTEMVRRAIEGNDHFSLSLYEMRKEGLSYTYQTLEMLANNEKGIKLYFIMGADSLFEFKNWREPEKIASLCTIVAAGRPGRGEEDLAACIEEVRRDMGARIVRLNTPDIDISSTMLRKRASEGLTIRYYVPDKVAEYIKERGLYLPVKAGEGLHNNEQDA